MVIEGINFSNIIALILSVIFVIFGLISIPEFILVLILALDVSMTW